MVEQTKTRSGWPARRTLAALDIAPANFYRWQSALRTPQTPPPRSTGSLYEVLASERQAIADYALQHPEIRHRELAWRMLDESVCSVSSSSVYRVLREEQLVCRWLPQVKAKGSGRPDKPTRPNELWQTDIRYTKVGGRNYYLLSFLDVYSRYIVHHELLRSMDAISVSLEAAAALESLACEARPVLDEATGRRGPVIQSDHGSAFVAREFAATLTEFGVGRSLIRPHTPTDNGIIERYHRTIGEQIDEHDLAESGEFEEARRVIADIIDRYNHQRLHAALCYLRPVDYYRGDPASLLAKRRRTLQTARELRKQENLKLRQRLLPWPQEKTVTCSERRSVSV